MNIGSLSVFLPFLSWYVLKLTLYKFFSCLISVISRYVRGNWEKRCFSDFFLGTFAISIRKNNLFCVLGWRCWESLHIRLFYHIPAAVSRQSAYSLFLSGSFPSILILPRSFWSSNLFVDWVMTVFCLLVSSLTLHDLCPGALCSTCLSWNPPRIQPLIGFSATPTPSPGLTVSSAWVLHHSYLMESSSALAAWWGWEVQAGFIMETFLTGLILLSVGHSFFPSIVAF